MKRYTETTKWSDPTFRRWKPITKTFWLYLLDTCDNAGVWKIDYDLASFLVGSKIDVSIIKDLNLDKTRVAIKGGYLVILDFIQFQIGSLETEHPTNLQKSCKSLVERYLEREIDIVSLVKSRPNDDQTMNNATGINIKVIDKGKGKNIKVKHKEYVFLSNTEHITLIDKYGKFVIDTFIGRLNNYIGSKGKQYKSHYHTILAWINKDGVNPKQKKEIIPVEEQVMSVEERQKMSEAIKGLTKGIGGFDE